jgi:hypothetical protein
MKEPRWTERTPSIELRLTGSSLRSGFNLRVLRGEDRVLVVKIGRDLVLRLVDEP